MKTVIIFTISIILKKQCGSAKELMQARLPLLERVNMQMVKKSQSLHDCIVNVSEAVIRGLGNFVFSHPDDPSPSILYGPSVIYGPTSIEHRILFHLHVVLPWLYS